MSVGVRTLAFHLILYGVGLGAFEGAGFLTLKSEAFCMAASGFRASA